jgi:hypothetical protein
MIMLASLRPALAFHGHLLFLVLAPSLHLFGRGLGPGRSSGEMWSIDHLRARNTALRAA